MSQRPFPGSKNLQSDLKRNENATLGSRWEGGMRECFPGDPTPLVFFFVHLVEINFAGCWRERWSWRRILRVERGGGESLV